MDERTISNIWAPPNASSHDRDQRSNGTTFTGLNPRTPQPRANGRSLLSLNRHRNSLLTNPPRSDNSSNATLSRNDIQLPGIPNIRFRSVQNQPSRELVEGISSIVDMNAISSGEGTSPFPLNNLSDAASSWNTGNMASNSSSGGRRQGQARNRLQPGAVALSSGSNNVSSSGSSPRRRQNGTSPRRRNRRSNGTGSNNSTASTSATQAPPRRSRDTHQSSHQQQWRPAARVSDDSDEDIALMLMNAPPILHNTSMEDFMSPPRHWNSHSRGYNGDFRGIGTEDEPLELLNDSDVVGPVTGDSSPLSLSRDEEFARQLQQEEWERASTPMGFGFQPTSSRLQFLRAMHQALGSDDSPETGQNAPRRGRMSDNFVPAPIFVRGQNPLQIPALLELLPPLLMEPILGNRGPDEDDYETLLEMGDQIGTVSRGMSQRDINKIPVRKHKRSASTSTAEAAASSSSSASQDASSSECAICLSEFNAGESKRILPCQHELHKECIDRWLKTNATCPICRKDIRE